MSIIRARKAASKKLAIELKNRYNRLVTAGNDENEVAVAATDLGLCFNENIEFILWVLGTYGGMTNIPYPERINPKRPAANDAALPDISALTAPPAVALPACQCVPLEPGIIGNKHMTSCAHFVPA